MPPPPKHLALALASAVALAGLTLGPASAARADTTSVITIEGPAQETATAGYSAAIDGLLTIGGSPAPGGTVVYDTRTAPGGTTTQFTSTTDAGGGFEFLNPYPAAGKFTEAISYPGNTASGIAAAAPEDVVVTVSPPSLGLAMSWQPSGYADQATTISGEVTNYVTPSTPVSGQVINVTRTQDNSTATATWTLISDANGDASLTDVPATPGTYTYTFTINGTATLAATTRQVTETISANSASMGLKTVATTTLGKAISLTGALGFAIGSPAAGTPITVVRTVAGRTAAATFTTDTDDAYGDFALKDTPTAPGVYTYTSSYGGPAVTAPASASAKVAVQRVTAVSIGTSAGGIAYGQTVKVTIHLGTTQAPQTVSLLAQTIGSRTTRTVKTATVASGGTLTVSVPLTNSALLTAKVAGDTLDTAASATKTVTVAVKIGTTISGRYTTTRIGSTTYSVYHHTATLKSAVTVTPNKSGQCVELQVDRYYSGSWHLYKTTGCTRLNSRSQASLSLKLGTLGQFAVRAYYVHSSTDSSNLSTYGSWLYYKVVN